jgi:hypothetical protein
MSFLGRFLAIATLSLLGAGAANLLGLASHACCGVVKNGCCDVSALTRPAFNPSAALLPLPKPAIACTS